MKTLLPAVAAALVAGLLSTAAFAESLVLYTSQPNEDAQATVDAFEAANPGVEVEWVREGTTKIMAKLMAEIEAGNRWRTCFDRRYGDDATAEGSGTSDALQISGSGGL